jgi:hypothetical protein
VLLVVLNVKTCAACLFLRLHEVGELRWVGWIQEFGHDQRELFELNWFRHVRIEACVDTFRVNVAQYVGREGNDGLATISVFLLPPPDLFAGLVAVLVWHMQVALQHWSA